MANEEPRKKKISKESVEARLERLLREAKRPQASLLEENLVSIEQALARGVSRVTVWKALQEEGFTLTFGSFENALHRIRKKRAGAPGGVKPKVQAEAIQPSPKAPAPSEANPAKSFMETKFPGYKSRVTDKDREEYKALKEAIKDLPDREQRKRMEQFWMKR
jgi:hypothetical protein